MRLLTTAQKQQLIENGRLRVETTQRYPARPFDPEPVVKLFVGPCTWLLTEIDPQNADLAFGLCDPGLGFPELGYVSLQELDSLTQPAVERDPDFTAKGPLSHYTKEAQRTGGIRDE